MKEYDHLDNVTRVQMITPLMIHDVYEQVDHNNVVGLQKLDDVQQAIIDAMPAPNGISQTTVNNLKKIQDSVDDLKTTTDSLGIPNTADIKEACASTQVTVTAPACPDQSCNCDCPGPADISNLATVASIESVNTYLSVEITKMIDLVKALADPARLISQGVNVLSPSNRRLFYDDYLHVNQYITRFVEQQHDNFNIVLFLSNADGNADNDTPFAYYTVPSGSEDAFVSIVADAEFTYLSDDSQALFESGKQKVNFKISYGALNPGDYSLNGVEYYLEDGNEFEIDFVCDVNEFVTDGNVCQACASGYANPSDSESLSVSEGPSQCTACEITDCDTCDTAVSTCEKCIANHFIDSNECKEIKASCEDNEYEGASTIDDGSGTDDRHCQSCDSMANCATCSASDKCTSCITDFFINDVSSVCEAVHVCSGGEYILTEAINYIYEDLVADISQANGVDQVCVACSQAIDGCHECSKDAESGKVACSACLGENSHYLDVDDGTCKDLTECSITEYMITANSLTSDRVCHEITICINGEFDNSPAINNDGQDTSNRECVKCDQSCLTCNGPGNSDCLSCLEGITYNPGTYECGTP